MSLNIIFIRNTGDEVAFIFIFSYRVDTEQQRFDKFLFHITNYWGKPRDNFITSAEYSILSSLLLWIYIVFTTLVNSFKINLF